MFVEELRLIFSRIRNVVILILLFLVPIILGLVVDTFGAHKGNGQGPPFFSQITQNSAFLSLTSLVTVQGFLLPMAVAFVAGDSIAGEAQNGSLRYLLVAPISRIRLVLIKVSAGIVFGIAASAVIVVSGWITGLLLFPHGPVVTLSGKLITEAKGFELSLFAALAVGLSMISVVAISVMASTYTESPVAAVAVGLAVAIVSEILDPIPQLSGIAPLLLSNYWQAFISFFRSPADFVPFYKELLSQLCWLLFGLSGALLNFRNKDILN